MRFNLQDQIQEMFQVLQFLDLLHIRISSKGFKGFEATDILDLQPEVLILVHLLQNTLFFGLIFSFKNVLELLYVFLVFRGAPVILFICVFFLMVVYLVFQFFPLLVVLSVCIDYQFIQCMYIDRFTFECFFHLAILLYPVFQRFQLFLVFRSQALELNHEVM